jgi:hypothetical protein
MSCLYVNLCVTSLALYLTTSLFSFRLRMNTQNPTWKILRGVDITLVNTFLFLNELNSASIASFHLFQSECFLLSTMVFGSEWVMILSTMIAEKH